MPWDANILKLRRIKELSAVGVSYWETTYRTSIFKRLKIMIARLNYGKKDPDIFCPVLSPNFARCLSCFLNYFDKKIDWPTIHILKIVKTRFLYVIPTPDPVDECTLQSSFHGAINRVTHVRIQHLAIPDTDM